MRITATFVVYGEQDATKAWQRESVELTAQLARKYKVALVGGNTEWEPMPVNREQS